MKSGAAHSLRPPSETAQTRETASRLHKTTADNRSIESFVYFVSTSDRSLVKIGRTGRLENRLAGLLGGSPVPLHMLAAVPGDRFDESALHHRYLAQHSHYEWFFSTPQMLAEIEGMARSGEFPDAWRSPTDGKNPLHNFGIRGTEEWRAKISRIHKANWAKRKLALANEAAQ